MTTTLYRFFDAEDQLLYVGIADDPAFRWRAHRRTAFWGSTRKITLEHFETRKAALLAERAAIASERPRFNREHVAETFGHADETRKYTPDDIAADLRRSIEVGDYPPGSLLPSVAQLRRHFRVSGETVRRAKHLLSADGCIVGRHGKGVYVAPEPPIGRERHSA